MYQQVSHQIYFLFKYFLANTRIKMVILYRQLLSNKPLFRANLALNKKLQLMKVLVMLFKSKLQE